MGLVWYLLCIELALAVSLQASCSAQQSTQHPWAVWAAGLLHVLAVTGLLNWRPLSSQTTVLLAASALVSAGVCLAYTRTVRVHRNREGRPAWNRRLTLWLGAAMLAGNLWLGGVSAVFWRQGFAGRAEHALLLVVCLTLSTFSAAALLAVLMRGAWLGLAGYRCSWPAVHHAPSHLRRIYRKMGWALGLRAGAIGFMLSFAMISNPVGAGFFFEIVGFSGRILWFGLPILLWLRVILGLVLPLLFMLAGFSQLRDREPNAAWLAFAPMLTMVILGEMLSAVLAAGTWGFVL